MYNTFVYSCQYGATIFNKQPLRADSERCKVRQMRAFDEMRVPIEDETVGRSPFPKVTTFSEIVL